VPRSGLNGFVSFEYVFPQIFSEEQYYSIIRFSKVITLKTT
jgi:hypothetical protein